MASKKAVEVIKQEFSQEFKEYNLELISFKEIRDRGNCPYVFYLIKNHPALLRSVQNIKDSIPKTPIPTRTREPIPIGKAFFLAAVIAMTTLFFISR